VRYGVTLRPEGGLLIAVRGLVRWMEISSTGEYPEGESRLELTATRAGATAP